MAEGSLGCVRLCFVTLCMVSAFSTGLSIPCAAAAWPAFKIEVEETGPYRLSFQDLAAVAPGLDAVSSDDLVLRQRGQVVPLWVDDGDDGRFGPGDEIEFLGHHLAGEVSYRSESARFNVYRLSLDGASSDEADAEAGRMQPLVSEAARPMGGDSTLTRVQHLEEDILRLRLPTGGRQAGSEPDELWFWERIVGGYPAFEVPIQLADLSRDAGATVALRLQLRGWSRPRFKGDESIYDHRVDVAINGVTVAEAAWNGPAPYEVDIPEVPVSRFLGAGDVLSISSPRRLQTDGEQLIDVMMLNWIEIRSPSTGRVGERPMQWSVVGGSSPSIRAGEDREVHVYGGLGWRSSARGGVALALPEEETRVFATTERARPSSVSVDTPSTLRSDPSQTDYVMIAHADLLKATNELAEIHRARGLTVRLADVEDVYDEFSHGIRDPGAIRRFLAHARNQWQAPAPRFVLLVGDASWDISRQPPVDANYADWTARPWEKARFTKNRSTPYEDTQPRNLVPTLGYLTRQGPAASDTLFVADPEATQPTGMAIGRLPVTRPEEVAAIVDKIRQYLAAPADEAWTKKMVFITSAEAGFLRRSQSLAGTAEEQGFETVEIYPEASDRSNQHHTSHLLDVLDQGAVAVHFYGHGGRYIWRTGPRDLEKNHDLLTLDDLERLKPSTRLPVVLSMTCYSAPFDHPTADSIGEKFLRLSDRGAVAVIAASWRNGPKPSWSRALLRQFTRPSVTVGEALLEAKAEVGHDLFVYTYNLLGDPALPMAGTGR